MKKNNLTVQDWLDINTIFKNGIIKLKGNKYVKLIKIMPINFNLKSNLEKEAILNSYKTFLKTCNFDIQIIIQSNKEDLQKGIQNIYDNLKNEDKDFLNKIGKKYIDFLAEINSIKTSSSKDFYIIVSSEKKSDTNMEELIFEELNEKFFKIKECLIRCGNSVKNINTREETERVLFSFLNTRLFFS